ncbi:porin-like protein [Azomonas agilis]|uniref:Porin-like protein n=1 Tax=Azomonas agilis TaxID=116849 RepID=A0A562I2X9_9GAMM|nr:porin [Azomonas agilis]TWH65015.1 porin-like protein [Azomonas agilis]
MNKNKVAIALSGILVASLMQSASADILLYKKRGTTFATDGYFNTFYTSSDVNRDDKNYDRKQARVRMGYLPNYIGFNFNTVTEGWTVGGRSSFWVTINDSEANGTATAIDVRQFYGTVSTKWGEVLLGKDFGLFSRSNIFLDEMLAGVGNVSDTLGLVDGRGVSFGNIGTGFPYPFPTAQITYRNNDLLLKGLRIAVGIMDPYDSTQVDKDSSDGLSDKAYQEDPRYEFEVSYQFDWAGAQIYTWVNGTHQRSQNTNDDIDSVTSKGLGYGVQTKYGPWSVTTSGFKAEGINPFLTNNSGEGRLREIDSDGYLVQGAYAWGDNRVALSYGRTNDDGNGLGQSADFKTLGATYTRTLTKNLRFLTEYTRYQIDAQDSYKLGEDTNTFAIGAILSW